MSAAVGLRRDAHGGRTRQAQQATGARLEQRDALLLVDDDLELRELISDYLARQDYDVVAVRDGMAMDKTLAERGADLIILDLMLPGEDGLAIAKRLKRDTEIPIIIVSAQGEDVDRIAGLEIGADDYIAKPFNPRELLARIRAVLRRSRPRDNDLDSVTFGDFVLDLRAFHLTRSGAPVPLTWGEYELLSHLARHPNEVLHRDGILDALGLAERAPFDRSIDVRITRLRSKIEPQASSPRFIRTVWGKGYMFCPDAD